MNKRAAGPADARLVHEAARILCEERLLDYRQAKRKAAQRLGVGERAALPGNAELQAAVIEYQHLFGGKAYRLRLRQLRHTAVQAMRLLREFQPRLVGAVASGAVHSAHRVQLHAFADSPERLDIDLHDRGIPFSTGERRYRYPDGGHEDVPTISFMAGDIGVDVAIFSERGRRQAPLSPADGLVTRRFDLAEVELLLSAAA